MEDDTIKFIAMAIERWRNGRDSATLDSVDGDIVDIHGIACKIIPRPPEAGAPLRVDVELVHQGRLLHRVCVELPDEGPQTIH